MGFETNDGERADCQNGDDESQKMKEEDSWRGSDIQPTAQAISNPALVGPGPSRHCNLSPLHQLHLHLLLSRLKKPAAQGQSVIM